jgi:para-aminobenzoate synthetase component 1
MAAPAAWFVHTADGRSRLTDAHGRPLAGPELTGRVWADLRRLLNHPDYRAGRWIGYFSYDLAGVIESGKLPPPDPGGWPLVQLGYCPQVQAFAVPRAAAAAGAVGAVGAAGAAGAAGAVDLVADFAQPAYEAAIGRVIEYIAAGDVFQVNLAQRFAGACGAAPRELFDRLARVSPAWYGAYLELPMLDGRAATGGAARALLSTSPELFLQVNNGHVITRPIKGTRPASDRRDPTSRSDDPQRADLLNSEKDAAELHMIVDLLRNDLGKVCAYGSVRVAQRRSIESHPTVHHAVATVEGRLHPRKDIVDLLRAALPGGSVTGAPKVRAMQIIAGLEPVERGPYCGSIGWITKDACQLNIAIRTMCMSRGPTSDIRHPTWDVSFHVGGAIVADSEPAAEYAETLDKARAMLDALGATVDAEAR